MALARTHLSQLFGELAEGQRVLAEALELPEYGLLATETLVMALLESFPTRTPTDLARLTGLSRGRITHLINALSTSEREFVSKRQDHADRRRTIVSLTADGKAAAVAARARVERLENQMVNDLGAAGVDMLAQQLSTLRAISIAE